MTVDRRTRALDSLYGLALGDALGSQFFVPDNRDFLARRQVPPGHWQWTDDAEVACSVFAVLQRIGHIDQAELAMSFAAHHDFDRGYGRAWFGDDLGEAARQAALSAEVTHTHPDAVAGAIAVAVATALATRSDRPEPRDFLDQVLHLVPPGRVHDGVWAARGLAHVPYAEIAVHELGNGRYTSAHDTVPFALWAAARNLDDYEQAFWITASTGGDVDTTCAIVGGIVAANIGAEGLPARWRAMCEPLPAWAGATDSARPI